MRRARRVLEWHDQGGVWLARASRNVGGRYKITTRTLPDGVVYDVHRLVRTGPDIWRLSYVGSGISLERVLSPQL
jgi:hypothetical protein